MGSWKSFRFGNADLFGIKGPGKRRFPLGKHQLSTGGRTHPLLKKEIILYISLDGLPILVSPSRKGCEKLCLLSPAEFFILRDCDGERSAEEIAALHSLPVKEVEKIIAKWAGEEYGVLEMGKEGMEAREASKAEKYKRVLHTIKKEWISAKELKSQRHNESHYHQREISDAWNHFEREEVTVSHAYGEPHPALDGLTYGQRFADRLLAKGELRGKILEVGGGTGLLAQHLLDRLREKEPGNYAQLSYTFFDVSSVMLEAQRKRLSAHVPRIRFLENDIENGFGRQRYDLIILNEMIADLTVVKVRKGWLKEKRFALEGEVKEAVALIKEFQIQVEDAPPLFLFNIGALKVLRNLKKALLPGGKAYIAEYGSLHSYPKSLRLNGHTEHSIHFGHLFHVAKRLGLHPQLEKFSDFLGFNQRVEVIEAQCLDSLKGHLLAFLGREIPPRAYTEEMLRKKLGDFDQFANISFKPVGSGESFMDPGLFWMLSVSP